jgi:hypothetical protein
MAYLCAIRWLPMDRWLRIAPHHKQVQVSSATCVYSSFLAILCFFGEATYSIIYLNLLFLFLFLLFFSLFLFLSFFSLSLSFSFSFSVSFSPWYIFSFSFQGYFFFVFYLLLNTNTKTQHSIQPYGLDFKRLHLRPSPSFNQCTRALE